MHALLPSFWYYTLLPSPPWPSRMSMGSSNWVIWEEPNKREQDLGKQTVQQHSESSNCGEPMSTSGQEGQGQGVGPGAGARRCKERAAQRASSSGGEVRVSAAHWEGGSQGKEYLISLSSSFQSPAAIPTWMRMQLSKRALWHSICRSCQGTELWRRAGRGEIQRSKQKTSPSPANSRNKILESHMLLMGLRVLRPISLQFPKQSFLVIVARYVISNIK